MDIIQKTPWTTPRDAFNLSGQNATRPTGTIATMHPVRTSQLTDEYNPIV